MRRVVITGAGCVTPLGGNVTTVWNRLTEGQNGVGQIKLFDASNFPVRIAAEVREWSLADEGIDSARYGQAPRQTHFAIGAAVQAMRQSGVADAISDPTKLGVYLGCGEAFQDFHQFTETVSESLVAGSIDDSRFASAALRIFQPDTELELEPNMPACHIAGIFNAQGPNANCIAACASSTQAIGEAAELIRSNTADVMIAGGAHSMIHPFGMSGFYRLSALSSNNEQPHLAVRPFDRERDGFVVGEGGAIVILESLDHALARGAEIWGELTGYGGSQDAYRVTDSHPEGRGATACMKRALADAQLNPEQIGYINAHGTGTVVNDKVETAAVKNVFQTDAYHVPISSTKSMMGHFTTAGGAIELVVALMAIRTGVIPPTINYETPDPECDLDYVPNVARQAILQHVLSNSFGFGGQNAALVVSRYDERKSGQISRRAA